MHYHITISIIMKTLFRTIMLISALGFTSSILAQDVFPSINEPIFSVQTKTASTQKIDNNILNHLDLGITAGSTGIGIDFAMPITEYLQVRAGASYFPQIHINSAYRAEVGDFANTQEETDRKFNKLSELLQSFTGMKVNKWIHMTKEPTMYTAKFIVDVKPFNDKRWHISTGIYYGNANIGKTYNKTKDMTALNAISIYNNMYYKALSEEPMITYNNISVYLPSQFAEKFRDYGLIGFPIGDFKEDYIAKEDIYWDFTELDPLTLDVIHEAGDLRCAKGDVLYHKGEKYKMFPSKEDNMVKARCEVNKFRPYVGFGFDGSISKDMKTNLGFNCGVMFWGGVPKVYTHEGIEIVHDLTNLRKTVKDDVDFMKMFPVFPLVEVRLSRRLF